MSFLFKKYDKFENMTDETYKIKLQQIIDHHHHEITHLHNIINNLETLNDKLKENTIELTSKLPKLIEYCNMEEHYINNFMNKFKSVLSNANINNDFLQIINQHNAIVTGKTINDILLSNDTNIINLDIYIADTNYINSYTSNKIHDFEHWLYDVYDKLYLDNTAILINSLYKFNTIIKSFNNLNNTLTINLFIVDIDNIFQYIHHMTNYTIFIDGVSVKFSKYVK
jgi:hypothetical protein